LGGTTYILHYPIHTFLGAHHLDTLFDLYLLESLDLLESHFNTTLPPTLCMLQFVRNQLHYRMRQCRKQNNQEQIKDDDSTSSPSSSISLSTLLLASFYVLSGVTQPLLMTVAKEAGVADPRAQLYMFFYYLGPASVALSVKQWPSRHNIGKTCAIALFDLTAQAMNYTGIPLAGPTIFAIIYSSVTVWTAIFSLIFLKRLLSGPQWLGVVVVFAGLCITGLQSVSLGQDVIHGSLLVLLGSCMHALTYVMSEGIMQQDKVTVQANCAIQGMVCCTCVALWQVIYTRTHVEDVLLRPMQEAGTTWIHAALILLSFALANFVHALCFFFTLRHFPGGATSAGVGKGLQAVLVFGVTSLLYCGRLGGAEMCFSNLKLISLVVVVSGVVLFGKATELKHRDGYEVIKEEEEHV
jgi:drug/metabolite transporter (DMT)-like permease